MLAEIVAWFTEGFDATDLREAHALLDVVPTLESSVTAPTPEHNPARRGCAP